MISSGDVDFAAKVGEALPEGGLFHEKRWRISPLPFPISREFAERLEKLGHQLTLFVRACAQLYRTSADGRQPAWIAELLDRGKPEALVRLQREKIFGGEIPRVIRPDLILTDSGFVISELDSVPGGIGLTAWLGRVYGERDPGILGGSEGMLDGFEKIFPEGGIVVSEESATYRPEMEWLASQLNQRWGENDRWRVMDTSERDEWPSRIYRFFELFDHPNIPAFHQLASLAGSGNLQITPPLKPALEEKLWFALFWLRPLEPFWIRALGERTFHALRHVIPRTWLMDPTPLPPHAVIPELEIQSWEEAAEFSQKERDLILKISGFSERAWGSRGVILGSDVPSGEWKNSLREALQHWPTAPHILQKFHHAKVCEHPYLETDANALVTMRAKVRLCPYFFVADDKTHLGGALATLCPSDKKLLHGMSDAILVPTAVLPD